MIYLGQPYSHPASLIREQRFLVGAAVCAILASEGKRIFAPIVSWHPVATMFGMPTDAEFWKELDLHFLDRSDEFWLLTIEGWQTSTGLIGELRHAMYDQKEFKPIRLVRILSLHPLNLDIITPNNPTEVLHMMERAQGNGKDNKQPGPNAGSPQDSLGRRD